MYEHSSVQRLKEKVGYELWLLGLVSKTRETFKGGTNISTITLKNRQLGAQIAMTIANDKIGITDVIGSGAVIKVTDAMSALTFAASYKVLDMTFEWILEENHNAGNIGKVPWQFSEKIKVISGCRLTFPPLFQSKPYIRNYLFALYSNLLKFRNEVVHKNNFSVSGNKLRIDTTEHGQSHTLALDRGELGAFVRTTVAAAKLLSGDLSFGEYEDRLLRYHFDRIKNLHNLAKFNKPKPVLINVILKVPAEKHLFPADLGFVRQEISRIHSNVQVMFNLKVIGTVDDKPSTTWLFPVNSVPKSDVLELRADTYKEYQVPLSRAK